MFYFITSSGLIIVIHSLIYLKNNSYIRNNAAKLKAKVEIVIGGLVLLISFFFTGGIK